MTDKKKADWLCDLSLVLFVISLAFIAVLAASTAKLDDFTQIVAAILAAVLFIASMLTMVKSTQLFDGAAEEEDNEEEGES